MVLVKRRKYENFLNTNVSALTGTASAPQLLITHPAQGGNGATFLRARVQFSMSVHVGPTSPPSEIWWPVNQVQLIAWWSDSGSTAIGSSAGTSEHYLGSRLLSPVLTRSVALPTGPYDVTYTMRDDLVVQTNRKGSGVNTPHMGVGMFMYDPYLIVDGSQADVSINWQGHLFTLWGAPT